MGMGRLTQVVTPVLVDRLRRATSRADAWRRLACGPLGPMRTKRSTTEEPAVSGSERPQRPEPEAIPEHFARVMRARREALGLRIDKLAQRTGGVVDADELRSLEAGDAPTPSRETVKAVASSYEVDVAALYPPRVPVEIRDGAVAVGQTSVPFHSEHLDDVLVAFLELIRTLRGTADCPVVSFRRIDIEALGSFLDVDGSEVVSQLAVMVGAKKLRAAAMEHAFVTGAAEISSGLIDEMAPNDLENPFAVAAS